MKVITVITVGEIICELHILEAQKCDQMLKDQNVQRDLTKMLSLPISVVGMNFVSIRTIPIILQFLIHLQSKYLFLSDSR